MNHGLPSRLLGPGCDDAEVERAEIEDAAHRIAGRVRRTPVQLVEPGDEWLPGGGVLKLELLQHTGTFKSRGAFNRILSARESGALDRLLARRAAIAACRPEARHDPLVSRRAGASELPASPPRTVARRRTG